MKKLLLGDFAVARGAWEARMKREYFSETAEALKDIPSGTISIMRHGAAGTGGCTAERLETWTEGKGAIESFAVFPGIEVSLHRYAAERVRFRHAADGSVLAVNHCRAGRAGWHMRDGGTIYLGPGDLCIHSMDDCAESEIELPLGYYEGAAVAADLRAIRVPEPYHGYGIRYKGEHVEHKEGKTSGKGKK